LHSVDEAPGARTRSRRCTAARSVILEAAAVRCGRWFGRRLLPSLRHTAYVSARETGAQTIVPPATLALLGAEPSTLRPRQGRGCRRTKPAARTPRTRHGPRRPASP